MLENLRLHHHTAEQADELIDQLVDVYLDAHAEGGPLYNAERYRRQLAVHMPRAGWELVAATAGGELVGYTYGFPLAADTRWWDGIQEPTPAGFTEEDGRRTFAISELLVRRAWQRRGIARALHDELMTGRAEERTTLLVRPDNTAARSAYRSWGWQSVTNLRPAWDNAPTFMVLTKTLYPSSSTSGDARAAAARGAGQVAGMTHRGVLALVVCAAPPVLRIGELIELLQEDGWTVCLTATPTAATWIDRDALERQTGYPVRVEWRMPGDPEPHPSAAAVAVAPATFNVINKWAQGINDTLALGILNEALGAGIPVYAFPNVKAQLAAHPNYNRNLRLLQDAGVVITPLTAELDWRMVASRLGSTMPNASSISEVKDG